MDIQKARELVVHAGKQLVETGLIARTWGNVSCRISDASFAITPSGRAYETLTPEEIVVVNIADGSYTGDIKPSSEKGIHTAVYKHRPEINFVIHTHQVNASMVSPLAMAITDLDPAAASILGEDRVACASYGLPGTKKLKRRVIEALARSKGKGLLMAYHGALCLGEDYEQAFKVAFTLENVCADFVGRRYLQVSGRENIDDDELREYYVNIVSQKAAVNSNRPLKFLYNSERTGDYFKLFTGATAEEPFAESHQTGRTIKITETPGETGAEELPAEAKVHREIYRRNKEINVIIHAVSPDIVAVSRTGKNAYPLLDDFAQLIGTSVKQADYSGSQKSAREIAKKLKGRNAVLINNSGALCCGPSKYDASAAVLVMEKGCKAIIATGLFGNVKPINPLECLLMRFIYLTKYSKKAW